MKKTVVTKETKTTPENIQDAATIASFYQQNISGPGANYLRLYKNYFMYNMDSYARLQKGGEEWRSCVVSPVTHTVVNSSFNMLLESNTEVNMVRKERSNETSEDKIKYEKFLREVGDLFIPYMESKRAT